MKAWLRRAFDAASDGYSPDRVVADPELDARFLALCRQHGLLQPDAVLNRALLNLRKGGALRGLRSRRSSFPDEDQYRFASEMAVRFMERRDGVSLDDIIADPELAREFDALAARIVPGHTPLEYRWAALNLRKARRLKPDIVGRLLQPEAVLTFRVADLDVGSIPPRSGLYVLFTKEGVLYVGEAANLNIRAVSF
jgi:hypothetical protein